MNIKFENGVFSVECEITDNSFLSSLGFCYDSKDRGFKTPFADVANNLFHLADVETKLIITSQLQNSKQIYSDSFSTWSDIVVPCPNGLNYRDFQRAGIKFIRDRLRECTNVLLADQMGIGKTIQVLGTLNLVPRFKKYKTLVVCPASLKLNWEREANKWLVEKKSVHVVEGKDFSDRADISIINYDILDANHESLSRTMWDFVILDEAHNIKNPDTKRARALIGGNKNSKKKLEARKPVMARHKIALTGTPILNRPIEAFTTLKFLSPWGFHSRHEYAKRYCNLHLDHFGRWDESGASNLDELQRRLRSTIMIRRLKCDVLKELPKKVRQLIELQPDKNMSQALSKEWEKIGLLTGIKRKDRLDDEEFRELVKSLENGKLSFESVSTARKDLALEKLPLVIQHVSDAIRSSNKVIVFCHHKDVVQKLKDAFWYDCVVVDGSSTSIQRQRAVDEFQHSSNVKLFIGNIIAAGVGLTLTASSHVIFAELDWRPGIVEQAEDRAHRIGSVGDSVLIQHLVVQGSIDSIMAKTIIRKQEVIEAALDTNMSPDLRALLS